MANLNIKFNNKTYSIDSASLADATTRLEAHLMGMMEERLEGDGAEFHKLAPTALTFRSTAPLNELQEVQINGATVDPANYTLEEGSTVVTLPIEYLKTLDADNYEISVVSANKSVKGGFSVVEPGLNEYGFYYNQPYAGYVSYYSQNWVFFLREDGTMDFMILEDGYTETCNYEMVGSNITVNAANGTFTGSVSATEIYCNEVATTFILGDTSIVADEDYIYAYKEDLGGYEVTAIDKTKTEYGAIKTGINDIDTVKLADYAFYKNINLVITPKMPDTVINIGYGAFWYCSALKSAVIGAGVAGLDGPTFSNCISLQDIVISDSVTSIGNNAFFNCTNLKDVYITDIDAWCNISFGGSYSNPMRNGANLYLNGNLVTEATIPDTVTTLGNIFTGCASVVSVTIPDSVTSIGRTAFFDCKSLASIMLPDSVTSIGEDAFNGCSSLSSVVIGDSVTSIGRAAFYDCSSLISVVIGDSVTSIGDSAFYNCTDLTSIVFKGTAEQWKAIAKLSDQTVDGVPIVTWNKDVPATHVHCTDGDVAL